MFIILCQNCSKEIAIDDTSHSGTTQCTNCSKDIPIEKEPYYWPRLIVIQGGEKGKEFPFKDTSSLGRETCNTIQLKELKSSRRHAQISFSENSYVIEDLKSGNGTFVNGNKITQTVLKDKDLIHIAETIFMFRNAYQYAPKLEPKSGAMDYARNNIMQLQAERPIDRAERPIDRGVRTIKAFPVTSRTTPEIFVPEAAVLADTHSEFERTRAELKFDAQRSFMMNSQELRNIAEVEKANAKLRILYEVNHAISSILDLQDLLSTILEVVFKYIPAERGSILLYDSERDALDTAVAKVRNKSEQGPIRISKTMMNRIVKERVSLLTTDALLDNSLAGAVSIISEGIRSAMSVPLISKENLLGVLHIDATQISSHFNADNLELLTGIASLAAIAIENAKLLKKIEKEVQTRGTLQRYLSPELVEQIIHNKIAMGIGGELKKATMLFTDLRGFTKLTESIGAEAVVTILNDYFGRMVDIIFSNSGTLDKFIGDAIMGIWGLPIGTPDDTVNAVKTALQMQRELFYFNMFQREKRKSPLKMGAGINTGEVVVGNMGSPKRMEYTVIGPPVNLASRVESITAHNQILISENTYNEITSRVFAVPFPPTPLKGINRPIQIYGVVSLKEENNDLTFLPLLLSSRATEGKAYDGILEDYQNDKIQISVEPTEEITVGFSSTFVLDIPNVTPTEPVKIRCEKVETSWHGEEEFLNIEATLEEMPEKIKIFLENVFSVKG